MNMPPSRPDLRVHTISLTVEAIASGRYRLSSPHARGWAAEVGNQPELARAIATAFREVSVASYARAKNTPYDLEVTPGRADGSSPNQPRTKARRKTYHPGDWSKFEDGRWQSPSGRVYRENTRQVQGVIKARLERGMTI